MDFVLEVFVEIAGRILIELFAEVLFEAGVRGIAAMVRSWASRFLLTLTVGFVAGAVWGDVLADRGHTDRPRLFVVSLVVAAVSGLLALYRWTRDREALRQPTGYMTLRAALADVFVPWRWDALRLLSFAALNVAIAAGVLIGFGPLPG